MHPSLYFEVKTGLLTELEIAGVSGTSSWLNSNMAVIEYINVVPSLSWNGRRIIFKELPVEVAGIEQNQEATDDSFSPFVQFP